MAMGVGTNTTKTATLARTNSGPSVTFPRTSNATAIPAQMRAGTTTVRRVVTSSPFHGHCLAIACNGASAVSIAPFVPWTTSWSATEDSWVEAWGSHAAAIFRQTY